MKLTRRTFLGTAVLATLAPQLAFAAEPLVLGFSQVGAESEWRTANTVSIKDAAKKDGVTLKFADAQQKQENQVKAIRSFIAQKVAVIGSDFVEEGRRAGRWLLERVKKNPDAQVNIVELQGTVGSAPAIDRKKGFEEVIASNPHLKIIRSQTGDFTRAKGKEVMEAFLKAEGKKINVLYAHNDDMAIGAIQAIEEAGLKPGTDITIISVDGVKGAFEAMMAGKLNVTVECSSLLGPQLMAIARDVKAGKPVAKRITTEEGVFPAEVAAKEFPNRKY